MDTKRRQVSEVELRRWFLGQTEQSRLGEELSKEIFPICMKSAHQRYDAEDLTQEILIKVLITKRDKYRQEVPFLAWVRRVAINHCTDFHRRKLPMPDAQIKERPDDYAAQQVEDMALRRSVDEAAQQALSHEQQQILRLYRADRSYHEISLVTGLSESVLGGQIHRIKSELRGYFKRMEGSDRG